MLAVVDPGVGTARRRVAVEVGDGQSVLVGPDNGLLAPAVAMVGGATRAVELTNPEYQLPAPGPTFAGRDVFAPAAAHLCAGVPTSPTSVTPSTRSRCCPGSCPLTREEDGALVAEVLWIDRFGNCQLNVDPDEIAGLGRRVRLRCGRRTCAPPTAPHTYADIGAGEVGLVVDSYGLLVVCHRPALGRRRARHPRRHRGPHPRPVDRATSHRGPRRTGARSATEGPTDETRHHHRRSPSSSLLILIAAALQLFFLVLTRASIAVGDQAIRPAAASWSRVKRLAPPRTSRQGDHPDQRADGDGDGEVDEEQAGRLADGQEDERQDHRAAELVGLLGWCGPGPTPGP